MKKLILFSLAALPLYLAARDFSYEARVLDAKPVKTLTLTDARPDTCFDSPEKEFEALLAWDLGCDQPREVEATYWHVTYKLGTKTYTVIANEKPGETIPLRIRVNPLAHRPDHTPAGPNVSRNQKTNS